MGGSRGEGRSQTKYFLSVVRVNWVVLFTTDIRTLLLLIRLHGRGGAFETTGIGQDAATNARFAKLADKERLKEKRSMKSSTNRAVCCAVRAASFSVPLFLTEAAIQLTRDLGPIIIPGVASARRLSDTAAVE